MMEHQTIREIIESVYRGQIRIPAFQRGFIWEPDRVAFLIDSIYKGYPFGSVLFWRTKEPLKTERDLGPFKLPDPQVDFPIDYVLDGQQRITSIFGVFQTELKQVIKTNWKDIYFDFTQTEDVQESQFVALSHEEVDETKHFPLRCLFDTTEYRRKTKNLDDATALKIDDVQTRFKEARIPVQAFRTEEKEKVAIIFERINRQGVPLDTLQLLSAWTWSEDFQLQSQFEDLIEELEAYGFSELSDNISLLLRCTAAVLATSCQPESLVNLNGSVVRERFDEVINGLKGALDFLKTEFNVHSINNLPYQYILVPLCVFFSVSGNKEHSYTDGQRKTISRWFWRVSFSQRYSHGTMRNLAQDINEILNLKNNQPNKLGEFSAIVSPEKFKNERFSLKTVLTNTLVLMLARSKPINFIDGSQIGLDEKLRQCNKKEFHHLMPKAYLRESGQTQSIHESCLANFCFISRANNRTIGGDKPSVYKAKMTGDVTSILKSHIIPPSLFTDNFEVFIDERSKMLADIGEELCK